MYVRVLLICDLRCLSTSLAWPHPVQWVWPFFVASRSGRRVPLSSAVVGCGYGWISSALHARYINLSSCTNSTPCSIFCPGLTPSVFFLLLFQQRGTICHVRFYLFSYVVCGVLRGSPLAFNTTIPNALLREHDGSIIIIIRPLQ